MSEFEFKSCPVCREQLDQCLQCSSYVVNGERIYYEKLADFGATDDSERRFIKRIQKHSTTAFFHHGKLYIPSRQGRSVPLAIGLQWDTWQERQSEINQLKTQLAAYKEDMQLDAEKIRYEQMQSSSWKAEYLKMVQERDQLKEEKVGLGKQVHEAQRLLTTWRIKKADAEQKNEVNKAFYFGKCANELESALVRGGHE